MTPNSKIEATARTKSNTLSLMSKGYAVVQLCREIIPKIHVRIVNPHITAIRISVLKNCLSSEIVAS